MIKNYFIASKSCFIEILWHSSNRRACCYKRKLHIWLLKDKKCIFRSFHGIQNVFMVFESSQANKGTLIIPWLFKIWHKIESVLNGMICFLDFKAAYTIYMIQNESRVSKLCSWSFKTMWGDNYPTLLETQNFMILCYFWSTKI